MKFSCDQCQAQYMIADEKVGPKGVKVRCKKCGHIISVTKDDAAASAGTPAAGDGAPGSAFDDIFGGAGGGGAAGGGDERAPTKVFTTSELDKVRQEQNLAKGGSGPAHDEPPTQQMALAPKAEWYLAIHDEQVGPITLDDVQARWDKGEVNAGTLGWRAGLQDWAPVSQIDELKHLTKRPQQGTSKAAAVAAEVAKPAAEEKVKETVTWRPSGASALADLAKEATVEAPKPVAAPESSSPLPDFNPTPQADPFGAGFGQPQGPSTVWQFPTTTAKKSSGAGKMAVIAAAVVIAVLGVGGGALWALGIIPPKPQYGQLTPTPPPAAVAPPPAPASQAVAPPPSVVTPPATPPAVAKNDDKGAKAVKVKKGKGGEDASEESEDKPEKAAPPPKKKGGGDDAMDELLGGGSKKDVKATLSRDDVLGTVKSNLGPIQKCAAQYSGGGGKLPPKLMLKWIIKPSGFTDGHELANPDLKGTQVETCVVAALKKWRFPEYREGNIPVTFPVAVGQ